MFPLVLPRAWTPVVGPPVRSAVAGCPAARESCTSATQATSAKTVTTEHASVHPPNCQLLPLLLLNPCARTSAEPPSILVSLPQTMQLRSRLRRCRYTIRSSGPPIGGLFVPPVAAVVPQQQAGMLSSAAASCANGRSSEAASISTTPTSHTPARW